MIKWLALLLVLANVAFWGWTQGWGGQAWPPPEARQREPERLQQQVRPESIVVLSPRAASAALEQMAAAAAAASSAASAALASPSPSAATAANAAASAPARAAARPR
jgi:hypothetical protein